ncbi:MAG TPA: tetratricopeptide repeat protein [Thermoanaerobaculia bacterium]|nr:tetratricopeptide repeat protein [Thermoanaerobaculia bacterium]
MWRSALAAVVLSVLAGCASAGPTNVAGVARELRQRGVDPGTAVVPFEVTAEMRAWVHDRVADGGSPEQRLERLLTAIVSPSGLALSYEGGHTNTAREAFATHKANCLGFTSLFVGMARELGIPAFYLGVDDVERFEREGDLLVISGHVSAGFSLGGGKIKILEFTNAPKAEYHHVRHLADLTAIALYHSNHGAELLRAGQTGEALPWLREAVIIDPNLGDAWVDLGVGLRRAGDLDGAEGAYRHALEVNPEGSSAYQNLAVLLRLRGHDQEADDLMALSTRAAAQSPFSFLALGDLSLAQGRTDEARRFYRRAMYLNRDDAEPYAALGLAALAGGDRSEAKKWLRKATARDKANERVRRLGARLAGDEASRSGGGGA